MAAISVIKCVSGQTYLYGPTIAAQNFAASHQLLLEGLQVMGILYEQARPKEERRLIELPPGARLKKGNGH